MRLRNAARGGFIVVCLCGVFAAGGVASDYDQFMVAGSYMINAQGRLTCSEPDWQSLPISEAEGDLYPAWSYPLGRDLEEHKFQVPHPQCMAHLHPHRDVTHCTWLEFMVRTPVLRPVSYSYPNKWRQ